MPRARKASDHRIPGEVWIAAPNGLISVSDHGRAMTMNGNLIANTVQRGQVRWSYGVRGKSYVVKASSLVAEMFLGGCHSDPVVHLNGDLTDIRASNLQIPWTKEQDDVIRAASHINRAAAQLGLSHSTVKRRAHRIGKAWPRQWSYTYGVPLEDRLDITVKAISLLEAAGVGDRDINLALGIPKPARRALSGRSIDICIPVLFPDMKPSEISLALGHRNTAAVLGRLRALGLVPPSEWLGRTKQGLPDEIDGEEWRLVEPDLWVSSHGRVATPNGLLSVRVRPGVAPFVYLQANRQARFRRVAEMMLAAFRPGMVYSKDVFIDGDRHNVRLSNIKGVVDARVAADEIQKRVYSKFTQQERADIVQAGVVAMMEGRATTYLDALKIGVQELHEIAGTFTSRSLDAPGPTGQTGLERLADGGDLSFETGRKANSSRWT